MGKEIIVEKLNELIEAAVENGADLGGSYNQSMERLYAAIEDVMGLFELNDVYKIVETGNRGCFSPYKIIRRENERV